MAKSANFSTNRKIPLRIVKLCPNNHYIGRYWIIQREIGKNRPKLSI